MVQWVGPRCITIMHVPGPCEIRVTIYAYLPICDKGIIILVGLRPVTANRSMVDIVPIFHKFGLRSH